MATTLAQLRTEVQTLYDISGSTVLTSSEWNTIINGAYRALWAEVTSVNKFFRVSTDTFTITTGQTRALPALYQETVSVRKDPNTDQMQYLTRFGPKTGSQMYMRTYRLEGTNLVIEPLQRAPGNYDHIYILPPPALVADGDQVDAELDQWHLYVVYQAVVVALAREESDVSQFEVLLNGTPDGHIVGVKRQVKQWAAGQRSIDPNQIENVRTYTPWQWTPP